MSTKAKRNVGAGACKSGLHRTVLLTGARAPVTLDMARSFWRAGWRVICADSVPTTFCSFSRCVELHATLPSPATALQDFTQALESLIEEHGVTWVIPMCEEVLYVSQIKEALEARFPVRIFTMPFRAIEPLHNKWSFEQLLRSCGEQSDEALPRSCGSQSDEALPRTPLGSCAPQPPALGVYRFLSPRTWLLHGQKDLACLPLDQKLIFKRVYSRFAAGHQVIEAGQPIPDLEWIHENPWIAQEFIEGERLCSYSISHEGVLSAHSAYRVLQSIGKIGSAVAFESIGSDPVRSFVQAFVQKTCYTGQICFDFLLTEQGDLYCLECNPRATSGVHLFQCCPELAHAILDEGTALLEPPVGELYREPLLTLWHGLWQGTIFARPMWRALCRGRNLLKASFDSGPTKHVPKILWSVIKTCLRSNKGFHEVTTRDLEFNGICSPLATSESSVLSQMVGAGERSSPAEHEAEPHQAAIRRIEVEPRKEE